MRLDFEDADAALLTKGDAPQANEDGMSALRLSLLLISIGKTAYNTTGHM